MTDEIYEQAKKAAEELCEIAKLKKGDIMVVGCSSSEIAGGTIGKNSSLESAQSALRSAERKGHLPGGSVLRTLKPRNHHGA